MLLSKKGGRNMNLRTLLIVVAVFAAGFCLPAATTAQSFQFRVIAGFNGTNGKIPLAGLVADTSGNLFGTTQFGGTSNQGVIFELPAGASTPIALASFNGVNGANSVGGLLLDTSGNLFGMTPQGGANQMGTIFELAAIGLLGAACLCALCVWCCRNSASPFRSTSTSAKFDSTRLF
jgi:uncharacterized repeat protein (TIGR03803 family)